MTVLRGCAFGPGTDAPYGPLVRALGRPSPSSPDDELRSVMGTATDELVRLLPELGPRVEGESDGDGETPRRHLTTVPERRQARLLEGVLGVLGRLGERRPLLLVIEDLHRADAATRTLVSFLSRIARSQRLAIVGTYQADAIRRDDPWSQDLTQLAGAPRPPGRLTLGPLDRDDLARLIECDRGRAVVGQRPGRGRRAVRRPAAGGRGAAGGTSRAAHGVADVVRSRTWSWPGSTSAPRRAAA